MNTKNLPYLQIVRLVKYIQQRSIQLNHSGDVAGDVRLKIKLPRNTSNGMRLQDIILVSKFRNNLMSIFRMTDNSYIFRKNSVIVKCPNGSVIMTIKCQGQLQLTNMKKIAFNTEKFAYE